VVTENLQAVALCVHVYAEYLFLLKEEKRISDQLAKPTLKMEEVKQDI